MIKRLKIVFCLLVAAIAVNGCIENDLPYPVIKGLIKGIEFEGQLSEPVIDAERMTVEVELSENVDLRKVKVLRLELSENTVISPAVQDYMNLFQPAKYTLTTYQDYVWTITASQSISRHMNVENQVGQAVFDAHTKKVLIYVSADTDLSKIRVLDMKLGPENSVTSPDFSTVTDFRTPQEFTCLYNGHYEVWSVQIVKSKIGVSTQKVNAYAKYAIAYGEFSPSLGEPSFLYRRADEQEWHSITDVDINGGSFSAKISGLEPESEYVIKAVAGSVSGSETKFTTECAAQIANSGFENWCKIGKSWFPNADLSAENYVWDSGNSGSNTLGEKNPTMPEESIVVSGTAAKLASSAVLGVFAAGNIYTGKYVETIGIGAKLDFGIPFTSRPVSLKGYYNYSPGAIDKVKAPYENLKGENDCCNIYIVLADWDRPFEINTSDGKFLDVKTNKGIIAYGEILDNVGTDGQYKEFEIKFEYRDNNRIPKYILVVAAASRYGDYFTGSTSSVLYVDEFTLSYE